MAVNSELLIYRSCKFGDEETDIHYNIYNILSGEYENTHINIPKDAELLYLSNDSDKLYYLSAPDVNDKREIICYTISNGSSKIIYTPPENQYINNASAIINS